MSGERPCYRHPNRLTAVSCSDCERPICPDCMVFAPVGIKCPEHAAGPGTVHPAHHTGARARRAVVRPQTAFRTGATPVTLLLVAANVLIYLIQLGMGASTSPRSGWIFEKWSLIAHLYYPDGTLAMGVAHGDWWRLITSAFLHANIVHLVMNMVVLWVLGSQLEAVLGSRRFAALYLVSGLAGSGGALVGSENSITVGASGAIYGIMGALLVFEYLQTGSFAGPTLTMIIINVALSFSISGISIGGHIGGLLGGIAAGFALARFGRGHMAYGRPGVVGIAALVAVGVVAVLVAYHQVGSI